MIKKLLIGLKSCTKTKISFHWGLDQKHELELGYRIPIREAGEVGRAKQKRKERKKINQAKMKTGKACMLLK